MYILGLYMDFDNDKFVGLLYENLYIFQYQCETIIYVSNVPMKDVHCSKFGFFDVLRYQSISPISSPLLMMTSSNSSIFHITGPSWGESTGDRWIPLTKACDAELWCLPWSCAWTNGWANNRDADDLIPPHYHYDVTLMGAYVTHLGNMSKTAFP